MLGKDHIEAVDDRFALLSSASAINQRWCHTKLAWIASLALDGLAIRNANRSDSHESIRRKKPYFHNVRAIRPNRLKPAIRTF